MKQLALWLGLIVAGIEAVATVGWLSTPKLQGRPKLETTEQRVRYRR